MGYEALAFAALGCCIGTAFRFKVLVMVLAILIVACGLFAIIHGYGFVDTALTIVEALIFVQCGYFFGTLLRFVALKSRHNRHVF